MSKHRGNKTRFARRRVFTVSTQTVGLPFFTCICNAMHLRGIFTVETGVKHWPDASKVPGSIPGITFFSSLLFFFSFSCYLVFILGITVLFCFYIQLTIFRFANFLLGLLAVPTKSFARSCDLRISSCKVPLSSPKWRYINSCIIVLYYYCKSR